MENNSHMESFEKRLKRFRDGHPIEIIDTLLNSVDSHFNNEIRLTVKNDSYQTTLLFLGIHAVALTISEGLFGKEKFAGYKVFLKSFVDGDTSDTKFSAIAKMIHDWRNILAHQWLGSIGHTIGYDYNLITGWENRGGVTFINPRIYAEHYLNAFAAGGKIWRYTELLDEEEMEAAKERLIRKYER